jgi:hypothetical protein
MGGESGALTVSRPALTGLAVSGDSWASAAGGGIGVDSWSVACARTVGVDGVGRETWRRKAWRLEGLATVRLGDCEAVRL